MLNELLSQIRRYDMIHAGDKVICAVSGGADSMALLWGLYLLREKLQITLEAAHFNHNLRGEESQRDEDFVRQFCHRFDIPLVVGSGEVKAGKKGLEAAARDARYAFLSNLTGKIATAHTADDNAETVLMHLVRGTGLKGLGGIMPVNGAFIRPMLTCTRQQVLALLEEYHISYVEDSSNETDDFLRNRLRHHVMPLLKEENPRIAQNLTAMAMELRQDEAALAALAAYETLPDVEELRKQPPAVRSRMLERFLKESGVKEPERAHIAMAESLVFSDKPSAFACFPGGVTVSRQYDRLVAVEEKPLLQPILLNCPGVTQIPELGLEVTCREADTLCNNENTFTVCPEGDLILRARCAGDEMKLSGGTKSLKKLFIDRKIPARDRDNIPVLADAAGVLGVYGIGVNGKRAAAALPAVTICFDPFKKK